MGLSLRSITKKIGGVAGGVGAQINPFDNGATFSNPHPQSAAPSFSGPLQTGPQLKQALANHQITQQQFVAQYPKAVGWNNNTGFLHQLSNIGSAAGGAVQHTIVQPVARGATELATSATGTQKTFHPGNPVERLLLGNTPVQNIEKKVGSQYTRQSQSSNPLLRVAAGPLAAAEGALSLGTDLPIGYGAAKVALKGAKEAAPAAKVLAKAAGPKIDPALLAQRNKYVVGYSNAKAKGNQAVMDFHASKIDAIDKQIADKQHGGYIRVGSSAKMPDSEKPIKNPELKDYYEAKIAELKTMDGHNVTVNKQTGVRSSDNSPVYQELFAKNNKPPTHQDYIDYIHQENMSGRGVGYPDPEEMAYYKTLLKTPSKAAAARKQTPLPRPRVTAKKAVTPVSETPTPAGQGTIETPVEQAVREARALGISPGGKGRELIGNRSSKTATQREADAVSQRVLQRTSSPDEAAKSYNRIINKNITSPRQRDLNSTSLAAFAKPKAKVKDFPTEAEFNKMIPSVPGTKQAGAAAFTGRTHEIPGSIKSNIPTNENPIKVQLSNPKASDYGAAITDKQRAESSISLAAQRAQLAAKKLSKNDRQLFAHARENPALIAQAENPKKLQDAITKYGKLTDTAHAYDVAAGGKTAHVANYYRHVVDLSNPEDAAKFEELVQKKGVTTDPFAYNGLNNQPRVFRNMQEGEQAGFKFLNKDPLQEIQDYANQAKGIVGNQALARGAQLADAARGPEAQLTKKFELGPGRYVDVSPEAAAKLRGVEQLNPSKNKVIKALRTANSGAKSTVLSLGQFHTINIGALRAAPTLIAEGHPVAAAKGLYGMFRSAFGSEYADRVIGKAIDDGTVDKAAKIGMPYGGQGYNVEGTWLKSGVGSKTVFGKQIPMMHDQVARSIIRDLEKKGVALDSPEAREAGLAGANLMGELNRELQNIRPGVRKAMTDWMLAGQFTPSKFIQLKRAATKGGVGGSYARANVAANVAASAAIIIGLGYAVKQNSDSIKDMLIRALTDPAVPTPFKDAKGNTVKLRLPGTDTSDVAKLLGIKPVRSADGHLGISWNPHNLPSTVSDFARARLSPAASAVVKVKTNTTFGSQPLYNPDAPAGAKAIQGATSLLSGNLPIGLQGLPQVKAVKDKLPGSVQDALNAQSPGSNPLVKSVGSSFGLSPSTDQTTGKALRTSQYFDSKDKFLSSLNANEKNMFNTLNPAKKDAFGTPIPVTSSPLTKASQYALLQANPGFLSKYVDYERNQSSHDPLWDLPANQLNDYINLGMATKAFAGPVSSNYTKPNSDYLKGIQNSDWYQNLQTSRNNFYQGLQAQGVKFSPSSSAYTQAPKDVQKVLDQLGRPGVNSAYLIDSNPGTQQWLSQHADEVNQQRADRGIPPLPKFPEPSNNNVRQQDATYSQLPTGTGARSAYLKAHPDYQAYWQQKQDYYTALGTGSSTTSSSGSYSGGKHYTSRSAARLANPASFNVDIDAGGKAKVAKLNKGTAKKKLGFKLAKAKGHSRPSVSLKKSLV